MKDNAMDEVRFKVDVNSNVTVTRDTDSGPWWDARQIHGKPLEPHTRTLLSTRCDQLRRYSIPVIWTRRAVIREVWDADTPFDSTAALAVLQRRRIIEHVEQVPLYDAELPQPLIPEGTIVGYEFRAFSIDLQCPHGSIDAREDQVSKDWQEVSRLLSELAQAVPALHESGLIPAAVLKAVQPKRAVSKRTLIDYTLDELNQYWWVQFLVACSQQFGLPDYLWKPVRPDSILANVALGKARRSLKEFSDVSSSVKSAMELATAKGVWDGFDLPSSVMPLPGLEECRIDVVTDTISLCDALLRNLGDTHTKMPTGTAVKKTSIPKSTVQDIAKRASDDRIVKAERGHVWVRNDQLK